MKHSPILLEAAKQVYWAQREAREKAFAATGVGRKLLATGGFHEAFARLEKPHVKMIRESTDLMQMRLNAQAPQGGGAGPHAVAPAPAVDEHLSSVVGARGGRYHLSATGQKVYERTR